MLVVSKQRVMRQKLNTDVNLIFSENVLVHTIIYKAHKLVLFTYITSKLLLSVMRSSLLVVVLGGRLFVHAPSFVGMLSLWFFSPTVCGSRCKQASRLPSL